MALGTLTRRFRPQLVALGTLAAGAITLPAAITTASAVETQAFILVYMLGASFAVQELVSRFRAQASDMKDGGGAPLAKRASLLAPPRPH